MYHSSHQHPLRTVLRRPGVHGLTTGSLNHHNRALSRTAGECWG